MANTIKDAVLRIKKTLNSAIQRKGLLNVSELSPMVQQVRINYCSADNTALLIASPRVQHEQYRENVLLGSSRIALSRGVR